MSRRYGLSALPSPATITPGCRLAFTTVGRIHTAAPASGVSPWSDAANSILAFPFVLEAPSTTFYKGFWANGTAAGGNSEVGIWDENYNKIVTTGSQAGSGNSVTQAFALSATVVLPPGVYYAGMAHSATTTNQILRWSTATTGIGLWQLMGCWKQAGITLGSLASTATPADMTNVAFPMFGLITRSVFDV